MRIGRPGRLVMASTLATLIYGAGAVSARQASETQSTSSKKLANAESPEGSQRQGFSVVLLLGDMQSNDGQDSVPAAARRALADIKDFLQYKSYRLLDTQWTLCCSTTSSAVTRLRGVEDQEYELELRSMTEAAGRLSMRFILRDAGDGKVTGSSTKLDTERTKDMGASGTASERQLADINREIFQLERERTDLNIEVENRRRKVEVGTLDPGEVKRPNAQLQAVNQRLNSLNQLKQQLAAQPAPVKGSGKTVIDTSFRMDVGETVVVGTSGLKGGNRALIALLTAVPKPKAR
jgi:hypothetical protein